MAITRLGGANAITGTIPTSVAPGKGKILQVVSVTWKDTTSSTSSDGTFANITGATASITPSSTSSKIFVQSMITTGTQTYAVFIKLQKGGSDISGALGTVTGNRTPTTGYSVGGTSDPAELQSTYISYLDTPSSTSSLTYTLQGSGRHTGTWTVNAGYENDNHGYNGRTVSTMTLMEIGA